MLHWWLIPLLVVFTLVLWGFYLVVQHKGGTGVRTEGKTVLDKPEEEHDLPPE